MKFLISIILTVLTCSSIAQTNKKKVLVVPYGRFEFTSKFSLEDIAEKNGIDQAEVFNAYQKALLHSFNEFKDENFEFVALTDVELSPYKKYMRYEDGKFNGKQYHAIKMRAFPEIQFQKLLDDNDANFIVFVNWYQIEKSSFTSNGKKRKRYKYSSHSIDFGLYNLFQQQIVGVGNFKLIYDSPSDEVAQYKGLRLTELVDSYQQIMLALVKALNKPISDK